MNRTEFFQMIELAELYAKDGAWTTAAERLRAAADRPVLKSRRKKCQSASN